MPCKPDKVRPPSLYRREVTVQRAASVAGIGALLQACSPAATLAANVEKMRAVAGAAERDGLTEHATKLRGHLDLMQRFREAGNMDAALVEAISAAAAFERLRADAVLAAPVDSYKRSRRQPRVTDEQIRREIAKHTTFRDAAAALDLTERQLRNHRNRMGEKRKSVRLPPEK